MITINPLRFMNSCHLARAGRFCALALTFIVSSVLGTPLSAVQTVIINDVFADGNRTDPSLPESADWFINSSTNTSTSVANGWLTVTALSGAPHVLAHFPATTIAIGEAIELTFSFTSTVDFPNTSNGLRFGLFSSNGNPLFTGNGNPSTNVYIGYAGTTNGAPASGTPTQIRKRAAIANSLITSTNSYTQLVTAGPLASFPRDTIHHARLRVERLAADSVQLTVSYTGGALPPYVVTVPDSSAAVTVFDTVAISPASISPLSLTNIAVIHYGPTPPSIVQPPQSLTVAAGDAAIFTASVAGSAPLSYQWNHNSVPIPGATKPSLTLLSTTADDAGDYSLTVTNDAGSITSSAATLTLDLTPVVPVVRQQPFSQTVAPGGTATFTVRASGTPPYAYQWRRNGVVLPGSTAATLSIPNVTLNAAGHYTVDVSNSVGSTSSHAATLTVAGPLGSTALLHDTFSGANITTQNLPASAAWWASSTSSPTLALQSGALLVPAGKHALAYFAAQNAAQTLAVGEQLTAKFDVTFSVVGTASGGFRLGLYHSNGAARAGNGENASFSPFDGIMVAISARYPDSVPALSSAFSLRARLPSANNGALLSTTEAYGPASAYGRNSQSFEAGVPYQFRLSVLRATPNSLQVTFTATGGALLDYGFQGELASSVSAFDAFAILSTSTNGSTFTMDNVVITHTAAPMAVAPTFLAQPQGATVNPGESVTFTADATGTPYPTFQWRHNEAAIDGATGPAYTIATVLAEDAGAYDVVVTNSAGSVTSNAATLTVGTPLTALQNWRVTYFGSSEATGNAADLADPDADGLVNLVEYALGFDPLQADAAAIPAAAAANGQWIFNYTRPAVRPGVVYVVEVSTNLTTWTAAGVTHEQVAVVGETAAWQARYPQASAPNLFFRLRVSHDAP